ncbi:MAG TPA: L-threonylcarbamoyladenylate synthase [Candidatus Deferrimicrobiaceae bacterium]|nr:L-threonylcarbamoyladenylate synthase [Candidatus Deferrimicrobiaceae bacterium]
MTRLVRLDARSVSFLPPGVIESLRSGGVVVYPTDTLYGLGVDPASEKALGRLLSAKGREGGKPIPLLLDEPARAYSLARHVPGEASRLMEKFWPGALTIVLPASPGLPEALTGRTGTVGLRVPDHPVARTLAKAAGGAITGTSANRSGNPGVWRTAEEIVNEFTGDVDWILWDGPSPASWSERTKSPASPGSTVVLVEEDNVSLLREGVIPFRTITDFLGKG